MEVFMLDTSLFLEDQIESLLANFLELYAQTMNPADLEFEPGFYNFFLAFVQQFIACSFGNPTFTKYLTFFMRMDYNPKYRKAIWTEVKEILNLLAVHPFSSDQPFLYPLEVDSELLRLYLDALLSKRLVLERNLFLYKVAIHHLALYIFNEEQTAKGSDWLRKELLKDLIMGADDKVISQLLLSPPQKLVARVMHYSPGVGLTIGEPTSAHIPASRMQLLQEVCLQYSQVRGKVQQDYQQL